MTGRPIPRFYLAVAAVIVLLVATLDVVRLRAVHAAAARTVGVFLGQSTDGLLVTATLDDGPAARVGVRAGDVLLAVADQPIRNRADFDRAAADFSRQQPVELQLRRAGQPVAVTITPGVKTPWWPHLLASLAALVCLTLGLLALFQGADIRARLVAAFSLLLAVELTLPIGVPTTSHIETLGISLFLLITGLEMAVELHLAALTPNRPAWLDRRPWLVPLFYTIGLGFGGLAWLTFHAEQFYGASALPWSHAQSLQALDNVILPAWALTVVAFLVVPTLGHPTARGRQQAGLVLLGVLPWALYILYTTGAIVAGWSVPNWLNDSVPLLILGFPVAVFVAIYRYDLFDLQLVVRRGFLYTALSLLLVGVFFITLGTIGSFYERLTDGDRHSLWVVGAAMFVVGLVFDTLRRSLQRLLDRLLFPETQLLRQRLIDLASALPARGTMTNMGRHLVERLAEAFGARSVDLLLADPKGGLFFSVASNHDDQETSSLSFLVPSDDPAILRLRHADSPLTAEVVLREDSMLTQRLANLDADLLVPLPHDDQLVGVLVLGRPESGGRFSREEQELLNLLGHHVAVVFENIRLFESATYEGLTGLLRREAILDLLDREIERARRYGRPLVVGMADLDYFKQINDRYGHLGGDAVLKRVAKELASGLRTTDAVGRYGGEEFLLVLPETELQGGRAVAEKLRTRIEALSLAMDDGGRVEPRISIGLADLEGIGNADPKALIAAADRALYVAKERGRNRVEVASVTDSEPAEGCHA